MAEKVLKMISGQIVESEIPSGPYKQVTQEDHGFTVGTPLRLSSGSYVKAQANSIANAEVAGIVSAVADADHFTLLNIGYISGLSGLVADTVYFLSDSVAGALTDTEPTANGSVSKPLLIAISATEGIFFNWRGALIELKADTPADLYNNIKPKGLWIRYQSATTVRIDCSGIWVQDYYKSGISNLDVAITTSGANGLDTGSEAASTWYCIWLIVKSSDGTTAGLLSTSSGSPTMPSGYDKKRLIGTCYNNSSSNIVPFTQRMGITNYWDQGDPPVLSEGKATSWTNVSISAFVPSNAVLAKLSCLTLGNPVSGSSMILAQVAAKNTHNSSVGYDYGWRVGQQVLGGTYNGQIIGVNEIDLLLVDQSFDYVLSANQNGYGSLYVWVFGYEIEL